MSKEYVQKEKKVKKRKSSVSYKVIWSLLAVMLPALTLLIIITCLIAAQSISGLNNKLLDAQADYAVSIVDDFFSGKVTAIRMFQEDEDMQKYFASVESLEDIENYEEKAAVLRELADVLEHMDEERVLQVWAVDTDVDCYLFSTGQTTDADMLETTWYEQALSARDAVVSEPYEDPAAEEQVVSIVTPVFSADSAEVAGFMGLDVSVDSFGKLLSEIKVGDNGYIEVISKSSDYIYSDDPTAVGKNVTELEVTEDYKNKVKENYSGVVDTTYLGDEYTAMFRNCKSTGWLVAATIPLSEVNATRNNLIVVLVMISLVTLSVLTYIIVFMIRRQLKPLRDISKDMEAFAKGDLTVNIHATGEDETGRLANSVRSSVHSLKGMIDDVSFVLGEISAGNLDVEIKGNYEGDMVYIKGALEGILDSLNTTLVQISVAAEQVSGGAEQVSEGAQALAQGASEQAGTVEELVVSVDEISRKITVNADGAADANKKVYEVGHEAVKSNERMQEMLEAMDRIMSSSREISRIIKTIEDIALQTNILALNADVEAARAGDAGRGFAEVASEVRKLASKSAEASRNTSLLIANSMNAAEDGFRIAGETAKSLQSVVDGVRVVEKSINNIAEESEEQSRFVVQVNQGILDISEIVQVNSATAQESAAASEELSAQALLLKELIGRFRIKED